MAESNGKKWYLSKTLWTNFAMGVIVVAVPSLENVLTPNLLAGVFMVVNMVLRFATKEKLQIK